MSHEDYIATIEPPSKKNMYQSKYDDYLCTQRVYSMVQPFTKIEKMSSAKYKAPRMIQARAPIFNILYGAYIKPLETHIGKYSKLGVHFGKGDSNEIAHKIHKLSRWYKYKTEADHKTFDAHVTVEMLKLTHTFYASCFRHSKELRNLSKRTLRNICISRHGIKYKTKGSRMSGDVDTSFGNSLINYCLLKAMLEHLAIDGEVIVNGDDSIIFTNDVIDTPSAIRFLRTLNMETEIMPSVENMHQVSFCQTKLVYDGLGNPTMMSDASKIAKTYGMTYKINHEQYPYFLCQLKEALAYMHSNNPIGQAIRIKYNLHVDKMNVPKFDLLEPIFKRAVEMQNNLPLLDEPGVDASVYDAYPNFDSDILYLLHVLDLNTPVSPKEIFIDHSAKTMDWLMG